jgi:hypothetical protein
VGILEISLTIWAWYRGWKIWSLLPVCIGLCLTIFIALVLYDAGLLKIYVRSIFAFLFVDAAVIAALISMIAKVRKKSIIAESETIPYTQTPDSKNQVEAERSKVNEVTVTLPLVKAKLTLPDNGDITISGTIKPIGRSDFEGRVSSTTLRYISRQHFWIRSDMGKYFIEDYQSANGTKLNGVDIKGRGLHLLKTGDKIDVAGILVLIFRVLL